MSSKNSRASSARGRITRAQMEENTDLTLDISSDPHAFEPIRLASGNMVHPSPSALELLKTAVIVERRVRVSR